MTSVGAVVAESQTPVQSETGESGNSKDLDMRNSLVFLQMCVAEVLGGIPYASLV